MAHTHTRTLSDTHIDNRCVRWNGRASTIVFTCKCKRFPPIHFLPPLLSLTPSPSNIYMQIDRTLVPLPFSRCHSERERHTQKEISTKRQMLQYYRALALSASVPWVAAANAGGLATVRLTPLPRCHPASASACHCHCRCWLLVCPATRSSGKKIAEVAKIIAVGNLKLTFHTHKQTQ